MEFNKDDKIVMTLDAGGTNFVFTAIQAGGFGHPGHGMFRCRVRDGVWTRHVRRDGPIIDNSSTHRILIAHQAESRLGAQERARQIDVDHVPPLLVG